MTTLSPGSSHACQSGAKTRRHVTSGVTSTPVFCSGEGEVAELRDGQQSDVAVHQKYEWRSEKHRVQNTVKTVVTRSQYLK